MLVPRPWSGEMSEALKRIDRLKWELDAMRPLPPDTLAQVEQKLRIESSYHSNAVEGNSLTLGETRSLILHGLTARGKPMRDHLDIEGHNEAVKAIEDVVCRKRGLTEVFIRQLHAVLLKEPYDVNVETPDGGHTKHRVEIGAYKSKPNNVKTSTGEIYYFTSPEQVKPAMSDLMDWYKARQAAGEHPIVVAATFHYRFVRIHPFDDGNGRMARLLMNMILLGHGYTVAIISRESRNQYIQELERADKTEDLAHFIDYIASCCEYTLDLYLKAARGDPIDEADDIDHEIALFKQSFMRREPAGEQVDTRKYVEEIVRPFRDYCVSKTELFSDVFSSVVNPIYEVKGKSIDGTAFETHLHEYASTSVFPKTTSDVSSKFVLILSGFQGKDISVQLAIENNCSSRDSTWQFWLEYNHIATCDGDDMDELKREFSRLLRAMMNELHERCSHS